MAKPPTSIRNKELDVSFPCDTEQREKKLNHRPPRKVWHTLRRKTPQFLCHSVWNTYSFEELMKKMLVLYLRKSLYTLY